MRQRIVQLEAAYERELGLLQWCKQEHAKTKSQLNWIIEQIEKIMPYSVCTPVSYESTSGPLPDVFIIDIERLPEHVHHQCGGIKYEKCFLDVHKLHRLDIVLEERYDEFKKLTHLIVRGPTEEAYYVSQDAYDRQLHDAYVVEQLIKLYKNRKQTTKELRHASIMQTGSRISYDR